MTEVGIEELGRPVEYVVLSGILVLDVWVYDGEIKAEELAIPVEFPVLKGMVILVLFAEIGEMTVECPVEWE